MPTQRSKAAGASETLARWFWAQAGSGDRFPRDMSRSVPRALPLALVLLPRLSSNAASAWLADRNVPSSFVPAGLRLQGLLIARGSSGIAFVDASRPDDEIRFSIAHEVAHFMLHHLLPRQRVMKAMGSDIQSVLDGDRPATKEEKLSAALAGVALGTFAHFDVDRRSRSLEGAEARREIEADLLAFELLAPQREMAAAAAQEECAAADLVHRFGLPTWAASEYANLLHARVRPRASVRDWFR